MELTLRSLRSSWTEVRTFNINFTGRKPLLTISWNQVYINKSIIPLIVKLGKLVSSLVLTVSIEDAVIDMGEGQTAGGLEVSLVSADIWVNL